MAASTNKQDVQERVRELFDFIEKQGQADYIGEAVSQLQHSLQAAQYAVDSHADDDTVLGALLHDIGRFIPASEKMPAQIAADGTFVGRASHEIIGAQYLKQLGFNDKVCQLVEAHVMAKRYLATDQDYYNSLSKSSKATLRYQGGIFNDAQKREAEKDPYLQDKLMVRRWDDLAKDPDAVTLPLSYYEDMAVNSLMRTPHG
ncbi:uncharacterized protein AB675_6878 [Cyphellophora attinorum]|uniref:HD domain-containing protein n=1 Tax=Cyphellophora attinorum TaxID=1664694 RepID=A0A0N0NQC1_9EURO|nr:uncharacterized protein AB675_6878 [Phialophora attinorum]KPI43529.1 hypothetical protein AB675_6878 [Phialophora attinorum]